MNINEQEGLQKYRARAKLEHTAPPEPSEIVNMDSDQILADFVEEGEERKPFSFSFCLVIF